MAPLNMTARNRGRHHGIISDTMSGPASYVALVEDVEVQQERGVRLRTLGGELRQKRIVLEDLAEGIEILFPGLPGRRVDLSGVQGAGIVMRDEIVRLHVTQLGIELPDLDGREDARARNV